MKQYTFFEIAAELEARNIDVYDVYGKSLYYNKWCDAKGYVGKDVEGRDRTSSQIWFSEYGGAEDGAIKEPPYLNLWHWFIDEFDHQRWIEPHNKDRYKIVTVTQEQIDRHSVISAVLTPFVSQGNGKIKVHLSVSR